jgi:hypothetical protein
MIKLTKEEFLKWVEKHDWLLVNEIPTPNGRQDIFTTPSGSFIVAIYDLKGDLQNVVPLIVMPAPPPSPLGRLPGLDLRGGSNFIPPK